MKKKEYKHKRRSDRNIKTPITIIGILLIVLITICAIASVGYLKEARKSQDTNKNEKPVVDKPSLVIHTEKKEEEIKVEDIRIVISAAGDCTLATDTNYAYGPTFVAKYNEVQDPSYFLSNVQEIFANDDLTIVNFEGALTNLTARPNKEFAFRADPSYVNILTTGSVEAVNLANNHSKDYGIQGFEETKQYLTEAGIAHFGYEQTAIYEVKGVKIGLVGINVLSSGLGCVQQLQENIQKVKAEGAIITIVNFHWGIEKDYYPNNVQKQLARTAIDSGADLVIGEHPHVLQGIETYNGKQIVYSLGNFCFGGHKNPTDKDSMIFQQTFTIRDGQVLVYDDVNIIPCSISSVSNLNNYQPTILTDAEAERVLNKIQEISAKIVP